MNKHVVEIVECIERDRQHLLASVNDLSQGQLDFRSSDDTWSVGEVLNHLHLTELGIVKLIKLSVLKAEKSGVNNSHGETDGRSWLTSLDRFAIETPLKKFKAIERIVPRAGLQKDDLMSDLRRSRAELLDAVGATANFDFAQIGYPHPFLGEFNLYQWIRFVGKHELRHTNQIEAIKSATDFPAPESARAI